MADFNVQRGETTIADTDTTATITAGTDYTAPSALSSSFIRITGTRSTATGGDGTEVNGKHWNVWISNPGNLLTSITFERWGSTEPMDVQWEIVEYVGAGGGANEFIVRDQAEDNNGHGSTTSSGGVVAGVADDAAIMVLITGVESNDGVGDMARHTVTAGWDSGNQQPTFTRVDNIAEWGVSYAVIEWTGSNWADVRRITHTFSAAGSTETETISPSLGSTAKAFIHSQLRAGSGGVASAGHRAWISATNELSHEIDTNGTISSTVAVTWIVENTQSGGTTDMSVQRVSGTSGSGQGEPHTFTEAITAVSALAEASIWGETSTSPKSGGTGPHGSVGLRLTATDTVTLNRGQTDEIDTYRFEVVEWPEEGEGGGGGGGGGGIFYRKRFMDLYGLVA